MGFEWGGLVGVGSFVAAIGTLVISERRRRDDNRKQSVVEHGGTADDYRKLAESLAAEVERITRKRAEAEVEHAAEIQRLVQKYDAQVTSLTESMRTSEAACKKQIGELSVQLAANDRTTLNQAREIAELRQQIKDGQRG